jgi:hypothetical protein
LKKCAFIRKGTPSTDLAFAFFELSELHILFNTPFIQLSDLICRIVSSSMTAK